MRKFVFLFLLLFPLCGFSEAIKAPELTPALTNQHEQSIIDEGIALHNHGKYEEAIAKYKQVLEKSPGNVLAMYEMASSYFSEKKFDDAVKVSYEGARYKSRYLGKFHLFIGNSLSELGRTDDAISAFRQSLEVVSDDAMIYFNLGVILINSGKLAAAQPYLEKAIDLKPTHSSSHYALSQVYFDQNNRTAGILAVLRFLSLEPQSKRSQKATAIMDQNLGIIEDSKKTEMDQKLTLFNDLFKTILEKNDTGKFVADHHAYFSNLQKNNLVAPFTYYIYQSTNREAAAWVEQHENEIQAYIKWSNDFVRP